MGGAEVQIAMKPGIEDSMDAEPSTCRAARFTLRKVRQRGARMPWVVRSSLHGAAA